MMLAFDTTWVRATRSQNFQLGIRVAGLSLILVEELLQSFGIDLVPAFHIFLRRGVDLRHVDARTHVGEDFRLGSRQKGQQGPPKKGHGRHVVACQFHAQLLETCEGVVRLTLPEGVDRMRTISKLQAIFDEALLAFENTHVLAMLEHGGVHEPPRIEGHIDSRSHVLLESWCVAGFDRSVLRFIRFSHELKAWILMPENWIAQEKDPLAGPDEVRVEGAIDREAGTQTAMRMEP
mmetsp:Transcript_24281/g.39570  ORF Transcript_24281/g.39570 Transcript_24281/m.39570 type:complete len:235 (+) Transcript_24281:103-807(+)